MKKYAIIVAGGSGSRMGAAVPKQFLLLNGKPVLYYTIDVFLKALGDCNIVLVLPEEHESTGRHIIEHYFDYTRIRVAIGGKTRFHSVQNGLKLVESESIVFVHDAVRCMVSKALIQRCYETAVMAGSAIPVIPCKDSIRMISDAGNMALPREQMRLVQTPQAFRSDILLPAFETPYEERFTDEATVVEAQGHKVNLVEGEENNFKITVPFDLELAERLMGSGDDFF